MSTLSVIGYELVYAEVILLVVVSLAVVLAFMVLCTKPPGAPDASKTKVG